MLSIDEAVTLFDSWEESATVLRFFFSDKSFMTVTSAVVIRDIHPNRLRLEGPGGALVAFALAGVRFAYADHRDTSSFVDQKANLAGAVCAVRMAFPNGSVAMLVEG